MFHSTEQAVDYGLKADALHLTRLLNLRQVYLFQFELALHLNRLNLASVFATQAQFCREALNAKDIQKRIMD